MVIRSEHYGDVYFSAQDGLAETRHVFLRGNDLPEAWGGCDRFVVCETGFGTGLNFLAVWKLFVETAGAGQHLHYISFEKHPLSAAEIEEALAAWEGELPLRDFLTEYRHCEETELTRQSARLLRFARNDITLELIFGDVNETILDLEARVDCWFLDGFSPAKNPDMWSETVFKNMARLSRAGSTFATFTAAGFVRRGLDEAGFDVRKVPGYGRKRDMLVGALR